jgi:OAA-family lectin sugar binding domain/TIR domain
MSGQIFISYRREESRWSARSLHDRLCRNFDPKQIFMDIDAIGLGEDFVKEIETTVAKCDVLIAIIGKNWLTSKDDRGDRRLENPEDFVRMEIGAALKREISVIPVLVDGALMPRASDLPEDLKSLVRRNALPITDTSFDGDCQRLAAAIGLVLEKAAAVEQERPVTTLTPSAQPEADKPSAETPKEVHPPAPKPSAQERVKPPSPSSGGIGRKSPSKQVIALLAIGAVLVVAGLIYLATRASQSPPPQPAPAAAVNQPSHGALTAPAQVAMIPYVIGNEWGHSGWNPGGIWMIGERNGQRVVAIDVTSPDNGATLNGTITYKGEGPIGFRGRATGWSHYIVDNQWGGNSAPWHSGGTWVLGNRDNQPVVAINVSSPDNGATLTGAMVYRGEGPIGFKGRPWLAH